MKHLETSSKRLPDVFVAFVGLLTSDMNIGNPV